MWHIGLISQVGADDIQGQAGLAPYYYIRSGRCAQQQVCRRSGFSPSCGIEMVLGHVPVQVQGDKGIVEQLAVVANLPFDFRIQAGRRDERQVIASFLTGIHAGEGTAQVQLVNGMDIDADFSTAQMRQAAAERIDRKAFVGDGAIAGGKEDATELDYCPPCGVCRQVMSEFCKDDFKIFLVKSETEYKEYTLTELVPERFTPNNLLG